MRRISGTAVTWQKNFGLKEVLKVFGINDAIIYFFGQYFYKVLLGFLYKLKDTKQRNG